MPSVRIRFRHKLTVPVGRSSESSATDRKPHHFGRWPVSPPGLEPIGAAFVAGADRAAETVPPYGFA